jgi:hypothetical protein
VVDAAVQGDVDTEGQASHATSLQFIVLVQVDDSEHSRTSRLPEIRSSTAGR